MSVSRASSYLRKARTLITSPRAALGGKRKAFEHVHYRRRLEQAGVWQYLVSGRDDEISIVPFDLWNIYQLIRNRKPRKVLEFGTGFSTIVIAQALHENAAEGSQGKVWSVNVSPEWIENTQNKMPDHLKPYSKISQSTAEVHVHDGELCHVIAELPNIKPDFIYLDGPSAREVTGSVRGLSYIQEDDKNRPVMSADILLLESSFTPGAFILIDGRKKNMSFLRRHLKRKYRFYWNRRLGYSTFELIDKA